MEKELLTHCAVSRLLLLAVGFALFNYLYIQLYVSCIVDNHLSFPLHSLCVFRLLITTLVSSGFFFFYFGKVAFSGIR